MSKEYNQNHNVMNQIDLNQQFYDRKIGLKQNNNNQFESIANIETPKFKSIIPLAVNKVCISFILSKEFYISYFINRFLSISLNVILIKRLYKN